MVRAESVSTDCGERLRVFVCVKHVVCYVVDVRQGGRVGRWSVGLKYILPVIFKGFGDKEGITGAGVVDSEIVEGCLVCASEFMYFCPEECGVGCSVCLCFFYYVGPMVVVVFEETVNCVLPQCVEVSLDA